MPTLPRTTKRPPWNPQRKPWTMAKDKANRDVYDNPRWRKIALRHKAENPICQVCQENPSEETHHVKPINEGGDPYQWDNLLSLCTRCHIEQHKRKRR